MAFEDDMIEAGCSDEQEYLDRLIDGFEKNYTRQQERELEYDDDYDSYDYEEEERERLERQQKRETEKRWIEEWKENNPDLALIWQAYFSKISSYTYFDNTSKNEYKELKKWLNERRNFESERQKEDWSSNFQKLISLYKNELFKFYFPEDEEYINISLISQQARELYSIEFYEPLLWEFVCSNYVVNSKLFENIEEEAFWNDVYKREMDYECWKDSHIEQYNQFAKQWIADTAISVYGEWLKKHGSEEIGWKKQNHDLWDKYKLNYEIREKNKFIETKIDEYKNKCMTDNSSIEDDFDEDDFDLCFYLGDKKNNPFLPDLECSAETSYDISSLDNEVRQYIQDNIGSFDMSKISIESSKYADKVLTQLWIYNNRDDWEMDALKQHHDYLFKYEQINSQELLDWWKEKYPTKWDHYIKTIVPSFKNKFEVVMKFRLWAFDGHKEGFISIADKYLLFWKDSTRQKCSCCG